MTEPTVVLVPGLRGHVEGPVVLAAHSAGVLVVAHWAAQYRGSKVVGALLATPPALAAELHPGYPSIRRPRDHGWLPVPRRPLPFPGILAASSDDPLGNPARVAALARAWGSRWHALGPVGHLNPASGYGDWPEAVALIGELAAGSVQPEADGAPPHRLQRASA
jgi:uncharacterized protein